MVNHSNERLDQVFHALSDGTRRAILESLDDVADKSVLEIAEPFGMSLPAILKHLGVLERAELIRRSKSGRVTFCRLNPQGIRTANRWLHRYERFWNDQMASLSKFLLKEKEKRRGNK